MVNLQELVDGSAAVLGAPVTVEDRSFRLLAFSAHVDGLRGADDVRLDTVLRRSSSPQVRDWFEQFGIVTAEGPVHTPASPELGIAARLCVPLRHSGVTHGYLWVADLGQSPAQVGEVVLLARAAAEELGRIARSTRIADERLKALLGEDGRAAERAAGELTASGRLERGVDVRVVVLAQGVPGDLSNQLLHTVVEGRVVLVVQPGGRRPFTADLIVKTLSGKGIGDAVAGVGAAVAAPAAATSLSGARVALQVVQAVPALGPIAAWDDLGPYRLLAVATATQLRDALVDEQVARVMADPILHVTAVTYLSMAGSVARTSQALHVHRQTLYYRLQRIETLTGLQLDDGEDRLRLHLALSMARVLDT